MNKDGKGTGNKLSPLIKELEEQEKALINKRPNNDIINRQKEILTRLLESEKAIMERGFDEKRESKSGQNENNSNLIRFDEYTKQKLKQIDGVVSLQTISWVRELRKPMTQIFKKISPNWICMSGLFYEGDISCKTLVYDHSLEREVYYNTYSLKELNRISNFYGYKLTKVKPFKIDIDISEPKNKDHMSTFTKRIADSSDRLQISGPILLNWYFVMIEKSNNS